MSRIIVNTLRSSRNLQQIRCVSTIPRNFTKCQRKTFHQKKGIVSVIQRAQHTSPVTSRLGDVVIESPFKGSPTPNQNLVEFLFNDLEENAMEFDSLTCGSTGRSYNFGMMNMLIHKFAQAVIEHCQMKPREVIGLLLPNIPEYVVVCHGAMKAGLPVTFVNPLYTANEIKRQFQNSEVKLIATVPQLLDVALEVGSELVGYRGTICVGGEDDLGKRVFGLRSLLMADYETELPGINPRELAIIPYSSGTTGVPKGVMLSHHNLVSNMTQIMHPDIKIDNDPDSPSTVFTVLPFFHIFGFNSILNISLKLRLHLVTLPRFAPEDYIKCLVTYKPRLLFVVPSLVTFLTENSNVRKEHLASVENIESGAAPLSDGLLQRFKQKFGEHIQVRQGYGMTESSPVTLLNPKIPLPTKHSSIGVLVPDTFGRVVDLATGDTLGPNKPGELQVKGPQIMMGYLNNEKATNETIDEDGWLHTGDIAYYDDDKYFYIIDRCKELIKVKGNQVSPTELENLLLEIPDVSDAAVVGVPDALADEVPRAFIVKKEGSELTDKDILKYVNARVVHYKKLAGGVVFIDVIPRNPSGKILRNELKLNECKYVKN
ncbi:probable 4-coumarate--CoA ligase 1 [Harmonia axyridis]|uniref:probable 4-coumarate--CoA ligase 1 n=1 Tax=Harmonia axyridis TaxID=115357 RepID=UPI001E27768C|nr:probable 4-coumarate--CoA ligase 1 [Harmonia axyridis]XP_045478744.1 probable 4-coumarate--CoA ligase 1 [Harmonia axyridis]XP_045478745.1 probable 4-coumarate--CoA ligase 1 [Harmonia axyridis]